MMRTKLNLFLGAALCLLLFIGAQPASAAEVTASGECGIDGDNLTWTVTDDGVLTISGSGDMANYEDTHRGRAPWFNHNVQSVVFEGNVTSIGDYAFWGTFLTEVTVPEGVTTIGSHAFNCLPLTSVTLPKSLDYIGHGAFGQCDLLESIVIPEGVTEIGYAAFYNCYELKNVSLPSTLLTIGENAFLDCCWIESIKLPDSLTTIGGQAFSGCEGLECIVIPESVTAIGAYAFNGCDRLISIYFTGDAFAEAISDSSLGEEFPLIDNENATAYYPGNNSTWSSDVLATYDTKITWTPVTDYCGDSLLWVITEEDQLVLFGSGTMYDYSSGNLTARPWHSSRARIKSIRCMTKVTSIGNSAFQDCTVLEEVPLNSAMASIGNWAFKGCAKLTDMKFNSNVTYIGICAFQNCTKLVKVSLPSRLNHLGQSSFQGCTGLTAITIPRNVTHIGMSAFADCTGLKTVTFKGPLTFQDDAGDYMFRNCTALTKVTLPEGSTVIYGQMFAGCTALTEIDLPDSIEWIRGYAFDQCTALTRVGMPEGLTRMEESVFNGCSKLTDVSLPAGLTSVPRGTFSYCSSLPSITIPADVSTIEAQAFIGCSSLEKVTFRGPVSAIEEGAFSQCGKLADIKLPYGLGRIGDFAFYQCTSLPAEFEIPETVNYIGGSAFAYATGLKEIFFLGSAPTLVTGDYTGDTNVFTDVTAKVYYLDDGSWTEDMLQNYGGTITWIPSIGHGECGDDATWTLYEDGLMVIRGTGAMYDYSAENLSTAAPWYSQRMKIKELRINDSVSSVGSYAFYGCNNLEKVRFNQSITEINDFAFYDCDMLDGVVFPESLTRIGNSAFRYCDGLTSITIPADTIEIMAFNGCASLETVIIQGALTESGNMHQFSECPALTTVVMHEGSTVISPAMFATCPKLVSVTLADSITEIGQQAFCDCTGLEEIQLPASLSELGQLVFEHCYCLKSITIPDGVLAIPDRTFGDCYELESVYLSANISYIDDGAFPNDGSGVYSEKLTIYAEHLSYAETYAIERGIRCEAIHEMEFAEHATYPCVNCDLYTCTICGYKEQRNVEVVGEHAWGDWATVTAPTCTAEGEEKHRCADCGHTETRVIEPAHTWGEWYTMEGATCAANGTECRDCAICWTREERDIPATGHTYTDVVTEPTCTTDGYTTHTCTACGDSYTDSYVPANGEHTYASEVTPPTCTAWGMIVYTCTACGHQYSENGGEPTGHNWTEWIEEYPATCTSDGNEYRNCTVCGAHEERVIPSTGEHSWSEWIEEYPATCTSDGNEYRNCTVCGAHEEQAIPTTGEHHYTATVTEPTCTAWGMIVYTCTACGHQYSENGGEPTGHDWTEWSVANPPTEYEDGYEERHCMNCGATETNGLPAVGHTHDYVAMVTEPTCTAWGTIVYTCTGCGHQYSENGGEPTGHDWGEWVVEYHATCTTDGNQYRNCTVCGAHEEQTIPAAGEHTYVAEVTEPSCTSWGMIVYTCTGCGHQYSENGGEPTGHNWTAWQTVKEPTETEDGYMERSCMECGATEGEGIPAAGHAHNYTAVVTPPTCTERGYTTYTCACGDSYVADYTAPTGHSYEVTDSATKTCTVDGWETHECHCGEQYTVTLHALGHTYDDKGVCKVCGQLSLAFQYADLNRDAWYGTYVEFTLDMGLMSGTDKGFEPTAEATRASIVMMLWNMAEKPEPVNKENPFNDVRDGFWYTDCILWAYENGIVSGNGAGGFNPNTTVTREQLTIMLFKFAEYMGYELEAEKDVDLLTFPDGEKVSSWAAGYLKWAVDLGLVNGRANGGQTWLSPQGTATRAEIAVIFTTFSKLAKGA